MIHKTGKEKDTFTSAINTQIRACWHYWRTVLAVWVLGLAMAVLGGELLSTFLAALCGSSLFSKVENSVVAEGMSRLADVITRIGIASVWAWTLTATEAGGIMIEALSTYLPNT